MKVFLYFAYIPTISHIRLDESGEEEDNNREYYRMYPQRDYIGYLTAFLYTPLNEDFP